MVSDVFETVNGGDLRFVSKENDTLYEGDPHLLLTRSQGELEFALNFGQPVYYPDQRAHYAIRKTGAFFVLIPRPWHGEQLGPLASVDRVPYVVTSDVLSQLYWRMRWPAGELDQIPTISANDWQLAWVASCPRPGEQVFLDFSTQVRLIHERLLTEEPADDAYVRRWLEQLLTGSPPIIANEVDTGVTHDRMITAYLDNRQGFDEWQAGCLRAETLYWLIGEQWRVRIR